MSADNGYLLRKNKHNQYVLQPYMGDEVPNIEQAKHDQIYTNLEEAVLVYGRIAKDMVVEYGLSVDIGHVTYPEYKCWLCKDQKGLLWAFNDFDIDRWIPYAYVPNISDLHPCPVCNISETQ